MIMARLKRDGGKSALAMLDLPRSESILNHRWR